MKGEKLQRKTEEQMELVLPFAWKKHKNATILQKRWNMTMEYFVQSKISNEAEAVNRSNSKVSKKELLTVLQLLELQENGRKSWEQYA